MIRTRVIAAAGVVVLLAGCTPPPTPASPTASTTAATTSPSASPSPTWDANQTAAVAALDGYRRVAEEVYSDPGKFSTRQQQQMFGQYVGYEFMKANMSAVARLGKKGWRSTGAVSTIWIKVSAVVDNHNERGLEVHLTVCQDYTAIKRLDKAGVVLGTSSVPYSVRQFSVRKPGKAWRLFGETASSGECHR